MVVLDTDHMTIYEWSDSPEYQRLKNRLEELPPEQKATTIVTFEEQTRGWLSYTAKARKLVQQIDAYRKLRRHLLVYREIEVLEFDETAATIFQGLKQSRLQVGTMDLRIAAITLAHNPTLLTRNTTDFRKVPGPKFEDWTA
jgi:tRNA(fMet)-specific endonuclease VapC